MNLNPIVSTLYFYFIISIGEKESSAVRPEMQGPLRALQSSARNIAKIFIDAKLECDEEEYVKSFNSGTVRDSSHSYF